jgi:hypothetical protein
VVCAGMAVVALEPMQQPASEAIAGVGSADP